MTKWKRPVYIILGISWIYFVVIRPVLNEGRRVDAYLKTLDLRFAGKVTNIKTSTEHDFGLINIDLSSSNKEFVYPRDSIKFFFCLIKDRKAQIVQMIGTLEIGDSIVIDTNKDSEDVYRNGNHLYHTIVSITESSGAYKQIEPYITIKK